MKVSVLVFLASLLLSTNIFSQDPNFHIYLCFGQSNMEGQGSIQPQDKTVDSRFQVLQTLDCSNLGRSKAECGAVGENWRIMADKNASNGSYVTATPGIENISEAPADDLSVIQMNFTIKADTSYYLYGRFNNPSANDDSYWIKIDDKDFELIDDLTTTGWQWIELKSLDLAAGEHTISIGFSEDGASLDKIVIKNSQISPVNIGEEAFNICVPEISSAVMDDVTKSYEGYVLEQNYPNPFRECTNISFEIPNTTHVSLKVINSQGLKIAELAGKEFSPGKYILKFNQEIPSPGNYFYTIKADKFSTTRKMIVLAK